MTVIFLSPYEIWACYFIEMKFDVIAESMQNASYVDISAAIKFRGIRENR